MFVKAAACGLPIDPEVVSGNAQRVDGLANISTHGFGLIEGRDRTVGWNDVVHSSEEEEHEDVQPRRTQRARSLRAQSKTNYFVVK
jgi:hypothetical protein